MQGVVFAGDRANLLGVLNLSTAEASMRCRLLCGKRTPETTLSVPPLGARLLSLETEFPELAATPEDRQVRAYVRITCRNEQEIAVQLLERAGEFLDIAQANPNAQTVAAASIAVAEVRALSTEISLAAGSTLFELAGSQATLAEHGLDRHWRNARVHTLHDPVRWKYHAVGNYYLNDENPPLRGTI